MVLSDSASRHTFLCSVVVCRTLCLNRSTDLAVIWHVRWHCIWWVIHTKRKRFGVERKERFQLQPD